MIFYSGFSLINDAHFFYQFLDKSDYTVAGFSYGAIKAAQYAASENSRIDTLQLFSPAFFQTKKESFKRLQLGAYSRDKDDYINNFAVTCFSPFDVRDIELNPNATEDELRELLYFEWTDTLMERLQSKGIRIEVYLGLEDKVIDVHGAREFFLPFATVTTLRNGNHFLQES